MDASRGSLLLADGREVSLRPKTWEVLLALLANRHRIVGKEELLAAVWPDVVVEEDTLVQSVVEIRKALGDDSRNPRYVRTVPRVGYRFIAAVTELEAPSPLGPVVSVSEELEVVVEDEYLEVPPRPAAALPPARRRLVLLAALPLAAAAALAAFLALRRPELATTLPSASGRTRLAVLLFENASGSRDLDWLRAGLTDMLNSDLSSSGRLTVLSRQQLEVLLRRNGAAAPPGLEGAVALAREVQADAFLLGSFTRIGDTVRLQAQLHDGKSGALLFADSATAERPEQIFAQVDLLSGRLLGRFGGPPGETPAPGLAVSMTPNLEAFRLYTLALEKAQAYHHREAVDLLEEAVALDPDFAMAYARIGTTYALRWGEPERARGYLSKAFALSQRLTDQDRRLIAAWYATVNGDTAGATRAFRELLRAYPGQLEAYQRLTQLLTGAARYEEAIQVAQSGLALDPRSGDLYNVLSGAYHGAGRLEEAVAAAQRYVELAPTESNAYDSLGLILQAAGRYPEAADAYREALKRTPGFDVAVIHLGNTEFARGRYREALAHYRRYTELVRSDAERSRGLTCQARALQRLGATAAARRLVQPDPLGRVLLAVEAGDFGTARALAPAANLDTPDAMRTLARLLLYARARLALAGGRAEEGFELLREMLRQRPPVWNYETYEDALANALAALGRHREAIAEYERVLRLNPSFPLARYRLACELEAMGERGRARQELRLFLEDWKDADPEVPELKDAGARLDRL